MIRVTLASMAVAMLIGVAPMAQAMTCKEQMTKAEPMMNSMTDATKKQEAMKHMEMAKDMMAKNDENGCMTHMQSAMDAMK